MFLSLSFSRVPFPPTHAPSQAPIQPRAFLGPHHLPSPHYISRLSSIFSYNFRVPSYPMYHVRRFSVSVSSVFLQPCLSSIHTQPRFASHSLDPVYIRTASVTLLPDEQSPYPRPCAAVARNYVCSCIDRPCHIARRSCECGPPKIPNVRGARKDASSAQILYIPGKRCEIYGGDMSKR